MDFKKARRRSKINSVDKDSVYSHSLQLYLYPPQNDITLEQFEEYAVERLKVLRTVEATGFKYPKNSEDYMITLQNELKKQGLSHYLWRNKNDASDMPDDELVKARRRDHTSHYILRLAYCKTDILRKWFISQEVDLFKCRFIRESWNSQQKFLILNNFKYIPISNEEKQKYKQELINSTYSIRATQSKLDNSEYLIYKVPYIEVLDLVSTRKVFIHDGFAFIPQPDLISVIINTFKSKLSHALTTTMRALPALEEDERLLPLVSTLSDRYIGKDFSNDQNTDEISPAMVDDLSTKSFPMCMRVIHETLRKEHHLKHGSRLQYSLFLKGIGMTLDGVLRMWKSEFTKVMDGDKFDKQYSYNIRHSFGKEGKRVNYTPYNCAKIINSNAPGSGDTHGCPFKHSNKALLEQRLKGYGVYDSDIQNIIEQVALGNYQAACSSYFEVTHKSANVEMFINHPNQYFSESMNIAKGKTDNATAKVKTTRSVVYGKKPVKNEVEDSFLMEYGVTADELDKFTASVENSVS